MAVYNKKITRATTVSENSRFTSKATVSVKNDSDYAIFSMAPNLILDNQISISNTFSEDIDWAVAVWMGYEGLSTITGNNSSKKITASYNTNSKTAISAYGILGLSSLNISGKKFLKPIAVSAQNTGNAEAFGIAFNGITSTATIAGNITVTASASGNTSTAQAFAITSAFSENNNMILHGMSGTVSVSAVSKNDVAMSVVFDTIDLTIWDDLSSKITSNAKGNSRNQRVSAYGFYCKSLNVENFDAKLNISASNIGTSLAYGICENVDGTIFQGGKKGSINVSAKSSDGDANAYGIHASNAIFANFSCPITVTADSKNNESWSAAIDSDNSIIFFCDISKNISVTAKNNRSTEDYDTCAWGMRAYAGNITAYDISANISVTAENEGNASAYCFSSAAQISFDEISGKLTAKSVNKEHYGDGSSKAYIFESQNGSFSADIISGTLNATATDGSAVAGGIITAGDISINDMSNAKITISSKSINGTATAVAMYSASGNLAIDADGLDFGTINVVANAGKTYDSSAYGINLFDGSIIASQLNIGQTISGKISVKSNGMSAGIFVNKIDIASSVNLTVSGQSQAYGYVLGTEDSNLEIKAAKIHTSVTDKNSVAYSIYALTGNYAQNVKISDKSTVTGNIDLAGGNDTIYIESGSKLKGALTNVEKITLDISDTKSKNYSMWDIVDSTDMIRSNLQIDFDYGLTGNFLICTKESSVDWDDAIQDGIDLSFNGGVNIAYDLFSLNQVKNIYSDSFYTFELQTSGNKMILAVTENI